eukprot:2617453-Lingulodinium_polyedra.AAC.1
MASNEPQPGASPDLLAKHPWLQTYKSEQAAPKKKLPASDDGSSSTDDSEPDEGPSQAMGDAEIEAVFKELHQMREQWQVNQPGNEEDFRSVILGGAWTKQHAGQAMDYFMGKACTSAAREF